MSKFDVDLKKVKSFNLLLIVCIVLYLFAKQFSTLHRYLHLRIFGAIVRISTTQLKKLVYLDN